MSTARTPGPDPAPGHEVAGSPDPTAPSPLSAQSAPSDLPRLDADGMLADHPEDSRPPRRITGPSPLPPSLVAGAGSVLTALAVAGVIGASPADGDARPLVAAVLAASLALGGFSLTRMLQLLLLARSRARRRAAGEELADVRWTLPDAHSLHAVWVIGVGASSALMGALGVWSLLDGRPSGLEPGWPLLLVGGGTALLAHALRRRISQLWEAAGDLE